MKSWLKDVMFWDYVEGRSAEPHSFLEWVE
jgi:hypothetical protein